MNETENKVRFVQGPYAKYNEADYVDAVYFAIDTKQLFLNGQAYGGNTIPLFSGTGRATEYFLSQAAEIISGVQPNICMVTTDDGNGSGIGYAVATYIDEKNFRVDYYAQENKTSGITENTSGELYRKFILYKDGQPTSGFLDVYDYDIIPGNYRPSSASNHMVGYKEFGLSSADGELKTVFWNGTDFTRVLLPTSKDVTSTYKTEYLLNFGGSPSLKFGSNTKYNSNTSHTSYQMILGGATTNVYCDNSWVVRSGKLISYSDGTRDICVCNQNGGYLSVGDRVAIVCDGDCIDMSQTSDCFSYSSIKDSDTTTHILTVKSAPAGDVFIAIKRYMYISMIGYQTEGNTKTFTVSTPSGVEEISVLKDPENLVTKDDITDITNTTKVLSGKVSTLDSNVSTLSNTVSTLNSSVDAINNRFPVSTSDIADGSVTKDKLAFSISSDSEKWFDGIVATSTISTSFPAAADRISMCDIQYDAANRRFVANATFASAQSTTVGSGTYLITNGYLATTIMSSAKFSVGSRAPQNSTPEYCTLYVLAPGLISTSSSNPAIYYYNGATLVNLGQSDTAETVDNINKWIDNAFN